MSGESTNASGDFPDWVWAIVAILAVIAIIVAAVVIVCLAVSRKKYKKWVVT